MYSILAPIFQFLVFFTANKPKININISNYKIVNKIKNLFHKPEVRIYKKLSKKYLLQNPIFPKYKFENVPKSIQNIQHFENLVNSTYLHFFLNFLLECFTKFDNESQRGSREKRHKMEWNTKPNINYKQNGDRNNKTQLYQPYYT